MAKGFKHGGGGGAAAPDILNFKIVGGTTAPGDPGENTIWVNTPDAITSWIFSPAEPANPWEGLLWITTGSASTAGFNALKENGIRLFPVEAKQYTGGAWTAVSAQTWQNGSWQAWWISGTLFAGGVDDEALTGGWGSYAYSAGSGFTPQTVSVSISEEGIRAGLSGSGYRSSFVGTGNKIDVSGFDKLTMEFSEAAVSAPGSGAAVVRLYSDEGWTTAAEANVISAEGNVSKTVEMDVSGLTGSYYIGWFLWIWGECALDTCLTLARLS